VKEVKAKGDDVNAYAVCQKATKQSYATGKPIKKGKPAAKAKAKKR
jgi:hypothetical protein